MLTTFYVATVLELAVANGKLVVRGKVETRRRPTAHWGVGPLQFQNIGLEDQLWVVPIPHFQRVAGSTLGWWTFTCASFLAVLVLLYFFRCFI